MKRVVYDESDVSSEQDDKHSASNKEESDEDDEEEEKDEDEEEEGEGDDTELAPAPEPNDPPEPAEDEAKPHGDAKEQEAKNDEEEKDEQDEGEQMEDEDDEEEEDEDIRLLLENAQDEESLQRLIQGSLGQLAKVGRGPGREVALAYIAAVSSNPAKFQHAIVLKGLLRLLRSTFQQGRERSGSFDKKTSKPKPPKDPKHGLTLAVLVANLLAKILKSMPANLWPDDCIKVFVDDSLHTRAWVDHEMCTLFVDMVKAHIDANPSTEVSQRIIEHLSSKVSEIKKGGGVNPTIIKNVMLTLMDLTPLPQGRLIASSNLDLWFQNTTHKNIARDLLLKIAQTCTSLEPHDLETVENLLNMKFKSVSFPQLKTEVFTLLVRQRPEFINIAIKVVLQKERLAATLKDVDNLKMMPLIFRETAQVIRDKEEEDGAVFKRVSRMHPGTDTSKAFAMVLQDMATVSSNLPTLKNTLRKVMRSLGQDQLDVRALCQGLMVVPKVQESLEFFVMMGELVALVLFVQGAAVKSLQVNVQEPISNPRLNLIPKPIEKGNRRLGVPTTLNAGGGINASGGGLQRKPSKEVKDKPTITPAIKAKEEFAQIIAEVQRTAINWCHEVQQLGEQLGMRLFGAVIRKIFFLDMIADMQPTDHDRGCFNFCKDMLPLHETTIVGLAGMCYYASPEETLEILKVLEAVVIRGAEGQIAREGYFRSPDQIQDYVASGGLIGLNLDRLDFALHLLETGVVRGHSYDGKSVCYSELYWLSCRILLILVAFNPSTIGASVWEGVPTMRCIMQMAITGRYSFPPVEPEDSKLFDNFPSPTNLVQSNQILVERERSFFQAHQLPTDLSLMVVQPPQSTARAPPIDLLQKVEALDKGLRLGLRLRKSRSKDFLMDMVDVAVADKVAQSSWSEGPEKIWWIVEIVCEEQDTLSYLPRRCLCELLLLTCVEGRDEKSKYYHALLIQQVPKLLVRLKECMDQSDEEVVTFFLDRLVSPNVSTRQQSSYILGLLTSETAPSSLSKNIPPIKFDWLSGLVRLPCFPSLQLRIIASLENVLKYESSIDTLKECLGALYDLFSHQPKLQLQLSDAIGCLLVQRTSVARLLLTDSTIFCRMVDTFWTAIENRLNSGDDEGHSVDWVRFSVQNGHHTPLNVSLPLHVVSGVVELLSFPSQVPDSACSSFEKLVACFFPENTEYGLLHPSQTYKCSAIHLFRLASVSHVQLMNAAIRKMSVDVLWKVALSYGRQPTCLMASLKQLSGAILSKPSECLNALVDEIGENNATLACEEAAIHLEMYLRQEPYAIIRSDAECSRVLTWMQEQRGEKEKETHTAEEPKKMLSLSYSLSTPQQVHGWKHSVTLPNFARPRLPTLKKRPLVSTEHRNQQLYERTQQNKNAASSIPWIRPMALGPTRHFTTFSHVLSKSSNVDFVRVCLNEVFALGSGDHIGSFLQAFLSHYDTKSLLPFAPIILDSIWDLVPWHVRGVWHRILRLIILENTSKRNMKCGIDLSRLALIRHIAFDIPNNVASTITALYNLEAETIEEAESESLVVQSIIMDLYLRQPHYFGLLVNVCAPGWDHTAPLPSHSGSNLELKLDQWLTSKDHTDSLRLVGLRHPLLLTSRVLHFAMNLEGKSQAFLAQQVLDNWLMAVDLVNDYIFRYPMALKHLVQCMLHVLEHLHDDTKLPTALKIFRTIESMVMRDSAAMLPYFSLPSYRLLWSHALAYYDVSNTHVAFVTYFLDYQVAKPPEIAQWNLPVDSTSTEDLLEHLKNSFDVYVGVAKTLVLPSLVRYVQDGPLTKKIVVLLCQCLLLVLHSDASCAIEAMKAYTACLTSAKVGLREAANFFLLQFLVYCTPRQQHDILAHLFMDESDVAKSSLSQYFKSDLFKAGQD
ncbi:Aste57867_19610 [Aphanomyces stellatus]|uniref:Aste57867_19610 protein n=1 Tax=Aphanomyces stellatus TaxID=120398 RepID=A0A485LHK1_9STRA|nr:hypothetical protein As57867_019546 [Aphanomyces stellatus]VFT96311.1 Aste57867_19610 [Aphanomyces stellatus]